MTTVDQAADPTTPTVSPRWRVIQRAVYTLIDEGKQPTQANLAVQLGVSRQAIWKFFRSQPEFLKWLDDQMRAENEALIGPLARRMFNIGMQGSVPHADMFAKLVTGHYTRNLGSQLPGGDAPSQTNFQMNFLIPRPEYPEAPGQAALPAVREAIPGMVIPNVAVNR